MYTCIVAGFVETSAIYFLDYLAIQDQSVYTCIVSIFSPLSFILKWGQTLGISKFWVLYFGLGTLICYLVQFLCHFLNKLFNLRNQTILYGKDISFLKGGLFCLHIPMHFFFPPQTSCMFLLAFSIFIIQALHGISIAAAGPTELEWGTGSNCSPKFQTILKKNQFHHHVLLIATSDFQTFRRLCAIKLHGHSDCFL